MRGYDADPRGRRYRLRNAWSQFLFNVTRRGPRFWHMFWVRVHIYDVRTHLIALFDTKKMLTHDEDPAHAHRYYRVDRWKCPECGEVFDRADYAEYLSTVEALRRGDVR